MRKWSPSMSDERKAEPKQLKTNMLTNETLPTLYVNSVSIQAGLDDFFLTFGVAQPLEITTSTDLEKIESINAQALFRCAVSRSMMKQMVDLMTSVYENQTKQTELLQTFQRKGEESDNNSGEFSES